MHVCISDSKCSSKFHLICVLFQVLSMRGIGKTFGELKPRHNINFIYYVRLSTFHICVLLHVSYIRERNIVVVGAKIDINQFSLITGTDSYTAYIIPVICRLNLRIILTLIYCIQSNYEHV